MSPDEQTLLDAYNKALHNLTLERGRKTRVWQLSQQATVRRLLLNGACVVFKAPQDGYNNSLAHLKVHAKPVRRVVKKLKV